MELTAGLAVFVIFVACLVALQRLSPVSSIGRWMENEVVAGCIVALVVAGLGLGMLLLFYGADLYLHSPLLDVAACIAILAVTIAILRLFKAPEHNTP
ncbi:MAG: hypothetical protein KDJ73_06670 [Notoacmeibacter sp.]|nr:hypothetical protein [Notoacmeibacter sp.]MCC0032546.1 hypothetical protein [Brucellaceae bacterium]